MKFGDVDVPEINPIPEIESSDEKEVFAFFGLASFNAQCAEKSLVNFVMAYKLLDEDALTEDEWLKLYNDLNSKTFGRLLGSVKKHINVSEKLIEALESTLSMRNWLALDFFYDYAIELSDSNGRKVMVTKLQELIPQFQMADRAVESLGLKVWEKFGVTEQWIQNEIERERKRYHASKSA